MRFKVFLPLTMPTLLSAFTAHWNFFDKACLNWYKDFDRFDIEANKGLEFWGEKISIFYEFNFGSYPYYRNYDENEPVNGGHPQLCNLTAHLEVVKLNITERVKNTGFNGLAVIDFEHWRPLFEENGYKQLQVYQNVSVEIARKNYPHLSEDEIKAKAKGEYDKAAKKFFIETIGEAKKLRPNGRWGFYGFPYCDYDAGTTRKPSCSDKYKKWNEEMIFLFEASDALYPSIYLENKNTPEERSNYVKFFARLEEHLRRKFSSKAILKEAQRIADMFSPPLPIYVYTKIEYDSRTKVGDFYDDIDLCSTIKQPADIGVDGIIFWGSNINIKKRCPLIKEKMEKTVGPNSKTLITGRESCRATKCSNHGKCILKTGAKCITSQSYIVDPNDYVCDCDYGYSGDDCSKEDKTITSSKCFHICALKGVLHDQTCALFINLSLIFHVECVVHY